MSIIDDFTNAEAKRGDEAISVGRRDEDRRATPRPGIGNYIPGQVAIDAIAEAQVLLAYAASAGTPLNSEISEPIARARAAQEKRNWNAETEAKFWPAKSKLGAAVQPVTVGSLAAGTDGAAAKATRTYFRSTFILSAIILPISIIMFIDTAISNQVRDLLKENDTGVIALHEQLVNLETALPQAIATIDYHANDGIAPIASQALLAPNVVERLAQFAGVSRQIFAASQILNLFVLHAVPEPWWAAAPTSKNDKDLKRENLEIDVRAGARDHPPIAVLGFEKIATYQDIRAFAKHAEQMNLVIYGAITAYILPIAYALLGAYAFALRNMTAQTGTKTYQPSYSNRARLIIALIAGTVVGLFNNFTQGVSVSPLAIAFLVGYGVEVFFSFLDTLVQTFQKVRNPSPLGTNA